MRSDIDEIDVEAVLSEPVHHRDGIIASVVVSGDDCAKAAPDKAKHIIIAEKTIRKPINDSSPRSPKRPSV